MRDALILFAVCFVLSCWIFVVGHWVGISIFHDIANFSLATIPIAYTVTGMTVSIIIAAAVASVFKRQE